MLLALALGAALVAEPRPAASPYLEAIERETIELFDEVAPSVVLLKTKDGFGSGFFVSPLGHILTNRHVVGTASSVQVVLHDGRLLEGHVVARGAEGVDVALIKVAAKRTPALSFASTHALRIGTWAGSVGHGRGGVWTLTTGLVSNAHGDRRRGVLQTQIPLNPGASGGPVFDRRGRVIGIVASGRTDSNAINFAITPETALTSLPSLRPLSNSLTIEAPSGAGIFVDGARVGSGPLVCIIVHPGSHRVEVEGLDGRAELQVRFPEVRHVTLGG